MTQRKNRKVYTKQDDPAPQPDFYGASDIMKLFDREPARLVDYLETAMERKNVVPTFHAMQFAKKIGMAFVSVVASACTRSSSGCAVVVMRPSGHVASKRRGCDGSCNGTCRWHRPRRGGRR